MDWFRRRLTLAICQSLEENKFYILYTLLHSFILEDHSFGVLHLLYFWHFINFKNLFEQSIFFSLLHPSSSYFLEEMKKKLWFFLFTIYLCWWWCHPICQCRSTRYYNGITIADEDDGTQTSRANISSISVISECLLCSARLGMGWDVIGYMVDAGCWHNHLCRCRTYEPSSIYVRL